MAAKKIIIKRKKQEKTPSPAVADVVKKVVESNKRSKAAKTKANTATMPVRAVQKAGSNIDWSVIKTAYVTDPKATHRSLETQFKVSRSAIAKHCKNEKWAEERQEYIKKTESNVMAAAGEDREDLITKLTDKHATLLNTLSEKITQAANDLTMDEWAAKNLEALAKASKLVIEGERLTVGLPSDVKGLSDPRGDRLGVAIETLHAKAKEVIDGKDNS